MILIRVRNIFLNVSIIIILALFIQFTRITANFSSENVNGSFNDNTYTKTEIPADFKKEKYLILYDKDEANSIVVKDNIKQTLKYIKKDFVELSVKDYSDQYKSYTNIITTFEGMYKFKYTRELFDRVNNGDKLFIAVRPILASTDAYLYETLGMEEQHGLIDVSGVHLTSNVLIKGNDIKTGKDFIENSSLDVVLNDKAKLLMESLDKNSLLWSIEHGKGTIVFCNGTMLNEKTNRGIIVGALGFLNTDFIYPIINMKLLYIDDFPSPIPGGINPAIYSEYRITTNRFYRDVWWNQMLKITKAYDVKYTGLIIESYSDDIKPPFEKPTDKDKKDLFLYGRELLKSGGEIGIHGYNHQSLAEAGFIKQDLGYKPWESEDNMKKSIEEVNDYAKNVFKDYAFRVYVPPSNILSPMGEKALQAGMKDLAIISAVYNNNLEKDAYVQEFEVSKNGLLQMPRLTSGYEDTNDDLWKIYNGATSLGVFSHFIHPDDVLDPERTNGKSWKQLSSEFTGMLKEVKDKYFWLRSMTASQGGVATKKYINIEPYIKYTEDQVEGYCDNLQENAYFILKSDKKIINKEGCEVLKIDDGSYIINVNKPHFIIKLK